MTMLSWAYITTMNWHLFLANVHLFQEISLIWQSSAYVVQLHRVLARTFVGPCALMEYVGHLMMFGLQAIQDQPLPESAGRE